MYVRASTQLYAEMANPAPKPGPAQRHTPPSLRTEASVGQRLHGLPTLLDRCAQTAEAATPHSASLNFAIESRLFMPPIRPMWNSAKALLANTSIPKNVALGR
jgi:hypothetical protein